MSTSAISPPPPSPPASRPHRNREPIYAGVGVAVAVVVLVVVFVAAPALTRSSSGSAGAILTYAGARPVADGVVGGFEGGGWNLLFAAGLVSASSLTVPVNTTTISNLSCTFAPVGSTGNMTLPAYTGNRSAGLAPAWEFGYAGTSGIALVSVVDGKGVVVGTLTGTRCEAAVVLPSIPGDVVDSSRAAAAVASSARAFLSADPNASAVFALGPAVFFGASGFHPEWLVLYTTCSASGPTTSTGSEFNATVDALTGDLLTTHTASGVSCSSSPFAAAQPAGSAPVTWTDGRLPSL